MDTGEEGEISLKILRRVLSVYLKMRSRLMIVTLLSKDLVPVIYRVLRLTLAHTKDIEICWITNDGIKR